jgi:hypothetical protein
MEFLLAEKKVPAQNEAFLDLLNRRSPVFPESSSLLKRERISTGIPPPRAQKRSQTSSLGGVFAHWKGQSLKPHEVAEGRHSSDAHRLGWGTDRAAPLKGKPLFE